MSYRYGAKAEPRQTCPMIDERIDDTKSEIEKVRDMLDKARELLLASIVNTEQRFEDIRAKNLEIREWGQGQEEEAESQEKRADGLEAERDALQSKLDERDEEIVALRAQVSELESAQ